MLYQVPLEYTITGTTAFAGDLLRSSVVDSDAQFFTRDPWSIQLGTGTAEIAWRPLPFEGTFSPEQVTVAMAFGGDLTMPGGKPRELEETTRCDPAADGCVLPQDGLPDVEVLDVRTGTWVQFAHMTQGRPYTLADAGRWVDPATGEVRIRFVNERPDPAYFQFPVAITGTIE